MLPRAPAPAWRSMQGPQDLAGEALKIVDQRKAKEEDGASRELLFPP